MQYLREIMTDDMDCTMEEQQTFQPPFQPNPSFVPKTELDYLMLGCLFESSQQKIPNPQSSPNTVRLLNQYQRQFEDHKKKSSFHQYQPSHQSVFPQPMNSHNLAYNMNKGIPPSGFVAPNPPHQHSKYPSQQSNNQNRTPNIPIHSSYQQQSLFSQSPPQQIELLSTSPTQMTEAKSPSKKDKKKPKRPNKVKPQGCEWCKVVSSPVWRGGPSGKGSLCNACGLQWMKGFTMERAKETLRKSRGEWKVNSQL